MIVGAFVGLSWLDHKRKMRKENAGDAEKSDEAKLLRDVGLRGNRKRVALTGA